MVSRCRALGNVVELALANALAHHELEIQANSDPLTGMANRRGLALFLEGDRRMEAMGIPVIDIDGLKDINDAHGHDVGDKILVGVARAVSGVLRGGDLLARTGGDEFVAAVAGASDGDARLVIERIEADGGARQRPGCARQRQHRVRVLRQERRRRPDQAAGRRGDVRGQVGDPAAPGQAFATARGPRPGDPGRLNPGSSTPPAESSSVHDPDTVVVPGRSVPHQGWLDEGTKPLFSAIMYHPHDFARSCPKSVE